MQGRNERQSVALWMPLQVGSKLASKPSWIASLLNWLDAVPKPMKDSQPKSPTQYWVDTYKQVSRSKDSEWLSWIEVCSLVAQVRLPVNKDAIQSLHPQRRAHDGHVRYLRSSVLAFIEETQGTGAQ